MEKSLTESLDKLRTICSRQEKCPYDVITLLKRWGIAQEHFGVLIGKLKSEKYIDEQRYASAFVRDKIKFDRWGITKIRIMLHQKGIDKSIIEDILKEVDRDEYRSMIGRELNKKRKSIKGSPYEIWAKLARYGTSRGYEMEYMEEFLGQEDA